MPSQEKYFFLGAGRGVSPTSGGGSSEALWAQVLCDLEPVGGRAQGQNSDVGPLRLPPHAGMGVKREKMWAVTCPPEPVCVCLCVCHSDLPVLFNEMADEGLLWLPGVEVTSE